MHEQPSLLQLEGYTDLRVLLGHLCTIAECHRRGRTKGKRCPHSYGPPHRNVSRIACCILPATEVMSEPLAGNAVNIVDCLDLDALTTGQ